MQRLHKYDCYQERLALYFMMQKVNKFDIDSIDYISYLWATAAVLNIKLSWIYNASIYKIYDMLNTKVKNQLKKL